MSGSGGSDRDTSCVKSRGPTIRANKKMKRDDIDEMQYENGVRLPSGKDEKVLTEEKEEKW